MDNSKAIAPVMNESQLMILTQQTPANLIRFRKGRGGVEFPFVDGAEVIRALNNAFGFDWDFDTDQAELIQIYKQGEPVPFEVKTRGKLTVRLGDKILTKTQYGSQAIETLKEKRNNELIDTGIPVSIGDAYKGAATDALKKCASQLGLFLDLYDSDAGITRQSVQQARTQQAKPVVAVTKPEPPAPMPPEVAAFKVPQDPFKAKPNGNGDEKAKRAIVKTPKWQQVYKQAREKGWIPEGDSGFRLLVVAAQAGFETITDDNVVHVAAEIARHYQEKELAAA